jgi:hypothetical protein
VVSSTKYISYPQKLTYSAGETLPSIQSQRPSSSLKKKSISSMTLDISMYSPIYLTYNRFLSSIVRSRTRSGQNVIAILLITLIGRDFHVRSGGTISIIWRNQRDGRRKLSWNHVHRLSICRNCVFRRYAYGIEGCKYPQISFYCITCPDLTQRNPQLEISRLFTRDSFIMLLPRPLLRPLVLRKCLFPPIPSLIRTKTTINQVLRGSRNPPKRKRVQKSESPDLKANPYKKAVVQKVFIVKPKVPHSRL